MFMIQWIGQQYVKFKGPLRVELPRPLKLLYEKQQRRRLAATPLRRGFIDRASSPGKDSRRASLNVSLFLFLYLPFSLFLSHSLFFYLFFYLFLFLFFSYDSRASARNTNDVFCPHSNHLFRDAVSVVFFNFYIFAHYLSLFHSLFFYCYYYYCTSCRFLGILLFPFPLFPFFLTPYK